MEKEMIDKIWDKASSVEGYDKNSIRKDVCGAWILYDEYGNRDSEFGWEIDHTYPVAKGGDNNPINLRAMHWRNNEAKGDEYPSYWTEVTSEGNENIEVERRMRVNEHLQKELNRIYGAK